MDTLDNYNRFEWFASGNAPLLYPTELVLGDFLFEDFTNLKIPESDPFANNWGKPVSIHLSHDNFHPAPKYIIIVWLSIVEKKFYAVAEELPKEKIEALFAEKDNNTKKPLYNMLVAGMAPYGKLALWLSGNGITTEVAWLQGKEAPSGMRKFNQYSKLTKEEYAEKALFDCKAAYENFRKNNLPDTLLFERYMQKYNYRITPKFDSNAKFDGIETFYYSGELNATLSGEHANVVMRAKPSKIVLHWSEGKNKYSGYFWTDEQKLIESFTKCYGEEAKKEGNLIIQVGASSNQFQFFLQTDDVSVEIPVEDMQYIIFKNKFEFNRSPNYNRPPQGWRS